jgi:hypothetical protein
LAQLLQKAGHAAYSSKSGCLGEFEMTKERQDYNLVKKYELWITKK